MNRKNAKSAFDIMTLSNTGPKDQTRVSSNAKCIVDVYLNECAPSHLLMQKKQMESYQPTYLMLFESEHENYSKSLWHHD